LTGTAVVLGETSPSPDLAPLGHQFRVEPAPGWFLAIRGIANPKLPLKGAREGQGSKSLPSATRMALTTPSTFPITSLFPTLSTVQPFAAI